MTATRIFSASTAAALVALRRSIDRARADGTRHRRQAWIAPEAWAGSTAYVHGQRSTNGGNIYLCITGGTSASSGGPTGTGAGPVTDGTVTWYYVGPAYTSDAAAPSVSTSTSAPSLGRFYRNAASSFSSGAAVVVSNDTWYERWGCIGGLTSNGIGYFGTGNAQGIAFSTDAMTIAVAQSNAAGNYAPIIEVDGRYVIDGRIPQASTSGTTYTTIAFPDRRMRRVVVRNSSNSTSTAIKGVYCDALGSIFAPQKDPGDLLGFFIGDSFSLTGSAYYGDIQDRGIAAAFFSELGIDKFYLDGMGGSGFVAGGSGNYQSATRIGYITSTAPAVIAAMCSVNDGGQAQPAITAAVNAWYAAVRATAPTAWIIIIGEMSRQSTETAVEGYVRQAVAALADSKMIFVPASGGAGGPWATGSGTVSAPSGSGNGDLYWGSDNIHPVARGQIYLGQRAGIAAANIIQGL